MTAASASTIPAAGRASSARASARRLGQPGSRTRRGHAWKRTRLALAGLLALLCGCISAPLPGDPGDPLVVPAVWGGPARPGAVSGAWWEAFGDAGLSAAVQEVMAANRNLRAVAARLDAAAAMARVAGAPRLPSASLGLSGQRQRQNFVGLPVPGGDDVLASRFTAYGVSLDLAWEVDLWGRLAAGERAALADQAAAEADLRAARLSLTAQAAKTWFALSEARQQVQLAQATADSYGTNTELVRRRYAEGLADPLDLRLAENNLATAKALLEAQREREARIVRQLEILLGRYPSGQLDGAAVLPEPPGAPPAGLPADLLLRRPDLVAAARRVAAADQRLVQAQADLWPHLRLTAGAGRSSDQLNDLLDPGFDVWSLLAGLTQPLFQGGRLRANRDLADARVREALARFGQQALQAFSEVETALSVEGMLARRAEHLRAAAEQAVAARRLAEERHRAGRRGLLEVLESQRRALRAQAGLLTVQRLRLEARVDLHLALGGGFEQPGNAGPGTHEVPESSGEGSRP